MAMTANQKLRFKWAGASAQLLDHVRGNNAATGLVWQQVDEMMKLHDMNKRLADALLHSVPYIKQEVDGAAVTHPEDEFPALFLKDVLALLKEAGHADDLDFRMMLGQP